MSRVYADEEREDALRMCVELGLAEAWRRTGIPKTTLSRWASDRGISLDPTGRTAAAVAESRARAAQLREEIRLSLLEHAADLLERMDQPHTEFKGDRATEVVYPIAPADAIRHYATSIGILIDKYRLEVGEATDRTEHASVTAGMGDHEREQLRKAIDEWLGSRA